MAKWIIDAGHSEIQFKVKHLAISNVAGTFKMFKGEVEGENFDNAKVQCIIDVSSLDTNNAQRDKDLKSDVFFDAQQFPVITFDGLLLKDELVGELTIRGVVKRVTMNASFTGTGKGRFNDERAGFEVDGKINRKDFGLSFNMLTETGSFVVGEEIKLHFDVEIIKQTLNE
jgi:polyisoprenoid-binding protein YceI